MLMLLMLVACTEETAEVDNLTRGEQYVQVRMQVPGMTAAATRAADGVIESVTALAFDTNGNLLEVVSATNITTERFNLTVPNGTKNIHFLANYNGDLSAVQEEIDLTTLTTNDYKNLVYWGMTTYEGTTNTLSTTLYRNMAKITLAPDEEFPFEGELTIAGLTNPNNWGYLVPWKDGVYTDGRVPNEPDPLTLTPIGNDGAGYGTSLYVLEHDNPNTNDGLYVICRIGDAFYKVALTSNGIDPYKIKRNHEYIIYVSDVDDYQADEYRTAIGDNIKDDYDIAAGKKPINLKVKEVESVTFNASAQSIDVDGNLTVTMTVPEDGTVTALTISAPGFTIKQGETILGNDGSYTGSDLTITGNNTTYTFVPNTFGQGKEITFTASGTNLQETEQTISVDVNAAISASPTVNNPTLYYDQDNQTVTVNVTMPKGLSAISIGGAENFTVSQDGNAVPIDNDVYTYTRNDATATQIVQFVFTLDKSKYTSQKGDTSATFTFTDASTAVDKATSASPVYVSLKPTPEVTFLQSAETIYLNGNPNYLNVTMTVPNGGTLNTLKIDAEGFTINNTYPDSYTDEETRTGYITVQYTFTPTTTEATTITFTPTGTNIKLTPTIISVTVKESSMSVTPDAATINMDANPAVTSTTLTLTKPANMQNVKVSITDGNGVSANSLFNIRIDNNYDLGQNNDIFNDINSSNTSVQVALSVKDNTIPSGSYTVRFADSNNQSTYVDATITVQNTPSLQFEYTNNATLYMDSNPQLPVTITVPDGSTLTQLNITATGFTIKQGGTTLSETGSYTYSYTYTDGTSTTFTFVPTNIDATTITFTGTGTNLKDVDETIIVTVKATKPQETVIWTPEEGSTGIEFGGWKREILLTGIYTGGGSGLVEDYRDSFVDGATINIYFGPENEKTPSISLGTNSGLVFETTIDANDNILSYKFEASDFSEDNADKNIYGHGLHIIGVNVIVTKITIIPAP